MRRTVVLSQQFFHLGQCVRIGDDEESFGSGGKITGAHAIQLARGLVQPLDDAHGVRLRAVTVVLSTHVC